AVNRPAQIEGITPGNSARVASLPAMRFGDRGHRPRRPAHLGSPREQPRSIAGMPAPRWFWRFMYDRESAAWERRRYELEQRELVERTADELANVVALPGPVADLGC